MTAHRLPAEAEQALAPVREAIAHAASRSAAAIRADADRDAAGIRDAAQQERGQLLALAAAEGARQAEEAAAERSARARRSAAEQVLQAKAAVRDRVAHEVAAAAGRLPTDPGYAAIRARLVERGSAVLGADAQAVDHPGGGVIMSAGSRRLDLSLPTLAARTLDDMSAEVGALWTT